MRLAARGDGRWDPAIRQSGPARLETAHVHGRFHGTAQRHRRRCRPGDGSRIFHVPDEVSVSSAAGRQCPKLGLTRTNSETARRSGMRQTRKSNGTDWLTDRALHGIGTLSLERSLRRGDFAAKQRRFPADGFREEVEHRPDTRNLRDIRVINQPDFGRADNLIRQATEISIHWLPGSKARPRCPCRR